MKISIIIPTQQLKRKKNIRFFYQPVTSLPNLLDSIQKNVKIEYEVIVVCNGNNDKELINYISKSSLVNKYCILNSNSGVSRAWNIGRMLAEGEILLFVNDDATFGENTVEVLYDYLVQNKDVGEVGPKGGLWNKETSGDRKGLEEIEEVDEISGFCFMTKAKVFDEVGGIDISYTPAGFEEIDYSFKIRKAGYKCIVIPNLDIRTEPNHGISALNTEIKYFNNSITTKELHKRNKEYFLAKWYGKK